MTEEQIEARIIELRDWMNTPEMISRREDWSKISKETWRFDCGGQRSCFSLFSQDESNFDPPFNWPIDNGDNSPG